MGGHVFLRTINHSTILYLRNLQNIRLLIRLMRTDRRHPFPTRMTPKSNQFIYFGLIKSKSITMKPRCIAPKGEKHISLMHLHYLRVSQEKSCLKIRRSSNMREKQREITSTNFTRNIIQKRSMFCFRTKIAFWFFMVHGNTLR